MSGVAPPVDGFFFFFFTSSSSCLVFLSTSFFILLPFFFYWFLWTHPQTWVDHCCGNGGAVDPCHRMAHVSHLLKLGQILAIASTASPSWPPPLSSLLLLLAGQFLNLRVYQLLGEDGVYYGVRFGKQIPWVHEFPFGYMRDPQYVGSSLSLLGCLCWVPWPYVLIWILGYLFMSYVESVEDVSSRAKLRKISG